MLFRIFSPIYLPQAEKKQVDLNTEEQAIREISKKWLQLEKKHDYTSAAALFADNGVLYRMNQAPVVLGLIKTYKLILCSI